jgi:hypothetical protein
MLQKASGTTEEEDATLLWILLSPLREDELTARWWLLLLRCRMWYIPMCFEISAYV